MVRIAFLTFAIGWHHKSNGKVHSSFNLARGLKLVISTKRVKLALGKGPYLGIIGRSAR